MEGRHPNRISRQTVLSALVGAAAGLCIGLAASSLWRFIIDLYGRRSRRPDITDMMKELSFLKSELADMRRLLQDTTHHAATGRFVQEASPFVLSDDDDDFFDVTDDISGFDNFQHVQPGSDSTDFLSAVSKFSRSSIGPPVPQEVVDELDQLSAVAMGDCAAISFTPKDAAGDVVQPGLQVYARCLVHRRMYRRSPQFLWRFARATYLAAQESHVEDDRSAGLNDPDILSEVNSIASTQNLNDQAYELMSRRQFVEKGLAVARRSLTLAKLAQRNPEIALDSFSLAEVYKWLAVMVGLASEFVGMQQRINYGIEFKNFIDQAIEHNADDPHSRYLRGRWCYEVYNLSWIERQFASRLFASPPTATLEEALSEFKESEKLHPDFYAANQLYLGKCFICSSNYKLAGMWLKKAKQLIEQNRVATPHLDTPNVRAEIDNLISRYSRYFDD